MSPSPNTARTRVIFCKIDETQRANRNRPPYCPQTVVFCILGTLRRRVSPGHCCTASYVFFFGLFCPLIIGALSPIFFNRFFVCFVRWLLMHWL